MMTKNRENGFHSGIVLHYQNVPFPIHANLMISSSGGSFFTVKIRNRFRSVRFDKTEMRK